MLMTMLLAVVFLTMAGYAHYQLASHTAGPTKLAVTRGVLIGVGIAFGYVNAAASGSQGGLALMMFLIGFGVVHVPAAAILFIKRQRGSGAT